MNAEFFRRFQWCRRWPFRRVGFIAGGNGFEHRAGTSEPGGSAGAGIRKVDVPSAAVPTTENVGRDQQIERSRIFAGG